MKTLKSGAVWAAVFLAGVVLGRVIIPGGAGSKPTGPLSRPVLLDTVPDVRQSTGYSCGAAALQAWRVEQGRPWSETWEDGHYVILIGTDAENLYFEDPSLLGSRGVIARTKLLERWHDYEGEPPLDERDRKFVHMAIFIKGERPASPVPLEPLR